MYREWRPYVPVAQRRANAARAATQLAKKRGRELAPISINGRKIACTFWGEAWCDGLESHSDFENRLPRGRTYVRNGSVIDLDIGRGTIDALVSGSEIYTVRVEISTLNVAHWRQLKSDCSASIDSLLDLLAGRFSDGVMRRLTDAERGLFPRPKEIKMSCSCPDWAVLCKHVAAVLYGVGARLDQEPQLLFLLRGVDHTELVSEAVSEGNLQTALNGTGDALAGEDLGAMFGIDLDSGGSAEPKVKSRRRGVATNGPATATKRGGKKTTAKQATSVVIVEKSSSRTSRSAKPGASAKTKRARSAKPGPGVTSEAKMKASKRSAKRAR